MTARVVFGVPVYNHARQLDAALGSMLGQTFRDLAVVITDDCSTDGTAQIAARYAERDSRVRYVRNEKRLGYIYNARRALEAALAAQPEAEYFAWGSDHDLWHPYWLQSLVQALDRNRSASLAWTRFHRINEAGEPTKRYGAILSSWANHSPYHRIRFAAYEASAGNILHGLIRASALKRTRGLVSVLAPDRLLIAHLGAHGEFVEVGEYLWSRRYGGLTSNARQRRNFFPGRRAPLHMYLPTTLQHGYVLCRDLLTPRYRPQRMGLLQALKAMLLYVVERNRGRYYNVVDECAHRARQIRDLRRQANREFRQFNKQAERHRKTLAALRSRHDAAISASHYKIRVLQGRMLREGLYFMLYALWGRYRGHHRQRSQA